MKYVLVGSKPPPHNGQSVAFQMLLEGMEERGIPFTTVDLTSRLGTAASGSRSWSRALEYVGILLDYYKKILFNRGTVYITIAQSISGFLRDLAMIWPARLLGRRIILHMHGGNYDTFYHSQPRWMQLIIRATLRQAGAILVLGEGLRSMYDFDSSLAPKTIVVSNGFPFKPGRLPESGKKIVPGDPVRLLYLSNLMESKGYLDVLEAVRILVKDYNINVQCRFCGMFLAKPGDTRVKSADHGREMFEAFIKSEGLEKHVEYAGVVSGEKKEEELGRAHFFVLPTSYDCEGQPISIIEAMAYGCVIISTNYRAIPDMLRNNKNGLFVEYGRPEQIASAIKSISGSPDRFELMSSASIELYKKKFTREAHLDAIIPLIADETDFR